VSLLTGERVLKLDRLSSVKPPFFHSLAANGGERVEEGTGGGVSACLTRKTWAHARQAGKGPKHFEVVECKEAGSLSHFKIGHLLIGWPLVA